MRFFKLLPLSAVLLAAWAASSNAANYDGLQTLNLSPNQADYTSFKANNNAFPWLKIINYGNADAYYRIGSNVKTATTSDTRIPAGGCAVTALGAATNVAAVSTAFTTLRVLQSDVDTSGDCPISSYGNVKGPSSSTVGNIAAYSNTSGTQISDTGVNASNVVVQGGPLGTPYSGNGSNLTNIPTTALTGNMPAARFNGGTNCATDTFVSGDMTCKSVTATGSGTGDVSGPASSTDSNLPAFNGVTGKLLKDSGIPMANVVTLGGALGTPASGSGVNLTGIPIISGTTGTLTPARGGTGLTALGTNVSAFLGSPTGAIPFYLACFRGSCI